MTNNRLVSGCHEGLQDSTNGARKSRVLVNHVRQDTGERLGPLHLAQSAKGSRRIRKTRLTSKTAGPRNQGHTS